MCWTNKVTVSCCWKERSDFLITSLCVFLLFISSPFVLNTVDFLVVLSCPSFTIFLIIFNLSLLLFSCCCDIVSLRGSIKFHPIWTWWNCVRLREERSLLYLVQILNWVWFCTPAALILRLMDFYSPLSHMWLSLCLFLLHLH